MQEPEDILGCWYKTRPHKLPTEEGLTSLTLLQFNNYRQVKLYKQENNLQVTIDGEYEFDGRFLLLHVPAQKKNKLETQTYRVHPKHEAHWEIEGERKRLALYRSYYTCYIKDKVKNNYPDKIFTYNIDPSLFKHFHPEFVSFEKPLHNTDSIELFHRMIPADLSQYDKYRLERFKQPNNAQIHIGTISIVTLPRQLPMIYLYRRISNLDKSFWETTIKRSLLPYYPLLNQPPKDLPQILREKEEPYTINFMN